MRKIDPNDFDRTDTSAIYRKYTGTKVVSGIFAVLAVAVTIVLSQGVFADMVFSVNASPPAVMVVGSSEDPKTDTEVSEEDETPAIEVSDTDTTPEAGTDLDDVPAYPSVYDVEWGDTLSKVSRETGASVDALALYNEIQDVNLIYAGSSLRVPEAPELTRETTEAGIAVSMDEIESETDAISE